MKNKSVYGIFTSRAYAANALDELKAAKFSNSDLKILYSPPPATAEEVQLVPTGLGSTFAGFTSGATLGGFIGFFTSISLGLQIFPNLVSEMISGPIVNALIGAGIGGLVGGVIASLVGIGFLEVKKKVNGELNSGGFLILADAPNATLADVAQDILKKNHAQDVCVTTV